MARPKFGTSIPPEDAALWSAQPSASCPGSSITDGGSGYWETVTAGGTICDAKGVQLQSDNGDSNPVILVHLVDDPATTYLSLCLTAGQMTGAIFDRVFIVGTTVTLADVDILF